MFEPEVIHDARTGQSERECHPDTCNASIQDKAEEVTGRQGDDEVSDERIQQHGAYIGYTS